MQRLLIGVALVAVATAAGAVDASAGGARVLGSELMELQVRSAGNEYFGAITDLLVDDKGSITDVVLRIRGILGMGERRYVVPWKRLRIDAERKAAVIDVPSSDRLAIEFSAFDDLGPAGPGGESRQ